jgi:hypothetical protein
MTVERGKGAIMELPLTKTPVVCPMLRTKSSYGTYETVWRQGESSTAVYWCLETMGVAGPDEELVHPKECRATRGCFKKDI